MTLFTANQPQLFPPVYMLNRWAQCRHMVFMEEAQFQKKGQQHRCRINTPGGMQYLTVHTKKRNRQPLNAIELAHPDGLHDYVFKALQTAYGRCPGYRSLSATDWSILESLLKVAATANRLSTLNMCTSIWLQNMAGLYTPYPEVCSSTPLVMERPDDPSVWIATLGTQLDPYPTGYLAGGAAMRAYLDPEPFEQAGFALYAQDWTMPAYRCHTGGDETDGYVSALDPLMQHGRAFLEDLIKGESAVAFANEAV